MLAGVPSFPATVSNLSPRLRASLLNDVTFPAVWAVQSRIASVTLLSLVALSHAWLALGVMAAWSLAATVLYFVARLHGAPDLLELGMGKATQRSVTSSLSRAFLSVFRIVLVGPPAFIYTRLLRLKAPGPSKRRRMCHAAVLATGATLFGVTTTHHILRKGGFEGRGLLKLSCVGSLLNVSYRTALSALMLAGLSYVVGVVV